MLADDALLERYDRTYSRHLAKAAARLQLAHQETKLAQRQADPRREEEVARIVRALEGVLDKHKCCRRCGRQLRDPVAVANHIGPECAGKPQP